LIIRIFRRDLNVSGGQQKLSKSFPVWEDIRNRGFLKRSEATM